MYVAGYIREQKFPTFEQIFKKYINLMKTYSYKNYTFEDTFYLNKSTIITSIE